MKFVAQSLLAALLVLSSSSLSDVAGANTPLIARKSPVDVTLFVMSRCPDAIKCEGVFSTVFKADDLPEVNPSLSYIGSIERNAKHSNSLSIQDSTGTLAFSTITRTTTMVTCKHGPLECAGNTQQLCFKKFFPDHKVWVPFVVAMNSLEPHRIGEPRYAREVGEKIVGHGNAATELLDKVNECSQGQEGFALLVESVQNTIDHGVGTSCTVFIDNKKRCVVDGGVWRECPEGSTVADFVRSIKEAALQFRASLTQSRFFRWTSS